MLDILNAANDVIWTYVIITMLVGCALYFTLRLRAVQFTMLGEMWRQLTQSGKTENAQQGKTENAQPGKANGKKPAEGDRKSKPISSFQAFAVSLSSRVGTGNLAGVASAIFVGGPGAVFWMWVMALLGASTAFMEATLAQLYKRRDKASGSFYGGPAYCMEQGLHRRWMGIIFAVLITITFGMANQIMQSNTLCDSLGDAFGVSNFTMGCIITVMTLMVIFGGIQRISRFCSICVPFMAIGYLLLALVIICLNITAIPGILKQIVESAFGINQVAGGMVGAAIMQGVRRGLFSNEAGEGSAPNAAAIADISHPVKQGLLQALGVFTDTLVICSCTAAIILVAGLYNGTTDGILLTTESIEQEIGVAGRWFLTAAIFLFVYSTIIANYFYGEANVRFICRSEKQKRLWIFVFRLITGVMVLAGGMMSLQTAWSIIDICMAFMVIVNLIAVVWLSPRAFWLLKDYKRQRREGKDPVFRKSLLPADIAQDVECWED